MNILFLCTGNSCRSILAEAIFNALSPEAHHAFSAGSQPKGEVHPRTLALLSKKGIPTDGYYSKSWDNLLVPPDVVITVCGNAAGETCPAYLAPAVRAHWGVEDPAHVTGTDDEIDAAFVTAYTMLRARIEAFFALPLEKLQQDKTMLKTELERIGKLAG
ncbi:arsenate reductase ArsC [Enterobacter kobei]|nr:arsenate reductase ArsC [Enterobacter kobei]